MTRICWPCVLIVFTLGLAFHLFGPKEAEPSAMEICLRTHSEGTCIYALR